MSHHLSLSRAARLAGVTRGEIQKQIRRGTLTAFEGEVRLTDLIRVYPQIDVDRSPVLERVEQIKAEAMSKKLEQPALPTPDVLMSRLKNLTHVLLDTKTKLNQYQGLLAKLATHLSDLGHRGGDIGKQLNALRDQILKAMAPSPDIADRAVDHAAHFFAKDLFLRILAANVKIYPSNHDFFVQGTNTILEAAIAAGLNPDYGCSSGNCGACKARVISGDVWKTRAHDYAISEREQQLGYILMCCHTAITDVILEAAEARKPADIAQQEIRSQSTKVVPISENLLVLHIKTPIRKTLRFMAGQRATLALSEDSIAEYPIASCPCDGRNLQFFIRNSPNHAFAESLFSGLSSSQSIMISGPHGDFVLTDDSSKPLLFIAFNDGFAPIRSLIEHAVAMDITESIHLIWLTSVPEGHYMDSLCRSWEDALDNVKYTPLTLNANNRAETADDLAELQQLLQKSSLEEPRLSEMTAYIAGSEKDIDICSALLAAHRLAPEQLQTEVV